MTAPEREAIGFRILTVSPQEQPIQLELPGKTDYDQNTLTKIRPRFDIALVEKVYVSVGQSVKKGDPLYDLKSVELATAKTDCRIKYVQWDHDRKYLTTREPLAKEGRITQKEWVDTQNDEKKSRLDYINCPASCSGLMRSPTSRSTSCSKGSATTRRRRSRPTTTPRTSRG